MSAQTDQQFAVVINNLKTLEECDAMVFALRHWIEMTQKRKAVLEAVQAHRRET